LLIWAITWSGAAADAMELEFLCIPRPLERSSEADGGPLRYRVTHRVQPWAPGEVPHLTRSAQAGELGLSV
jgi:alkaline phosphatase D